MPNRPAPAPAKPAPPCKRLRHWSLRQAYGSSSPGPPAHREGGRDDAGRDPAERQRRGDVAVARTDDDPGGAAADEQRGAHHDAAEDELVEVPADVDRAQLTVPARGGHRAEH